MESSSLQVPEERVTGFKRAFLKLGQKVGVIKKSEYTQEYLNATNELDLYKDVVADVCNSLMRVCQPNPNVMPSPFSKMEFESAQYKDPFEQLSYSLAALNGYFPNNEALTAEREASEQMAQAHRAFQQRARRGLHHMRTFLNVDCADIDRERRALNTCRQDMDFAQREYTKTPIDAKRMAYERAQQRFDCQMNKILELLNQIPQKKVAHSKEVATVWNEMRAFHDACAKECQKLAKHRA